MDGTNLLESLFRWAHVVAGILWIGLLWFFNFVNSNFVPTMDGDTKKKVVPELMPRALWAFRWGAAWTWITGLILLGLVYYNTGLVFKDPAVKTWWTGGVAVLVCAPHVRRLRPPCKGDREDRDSLRPRPRRRDRGRSSSSRALPDSASGARRSTSARCSGRSWRRTCGCGSGPRSGRSSRRRRTARSRTRRVAAMAGLRSKHNTYMSVPLIFMMLAQHATWAASHYVRTLPIVVLLGWGFTYWMYKKAATVKGF